MGATDERTIFGWITAETGMPADHPLRAIRVLLQPVLQEMWSCCDLDILDIPPQPARRHA